MRKCPSCNKSVSEYALKCPNCRFDLSKSAAQETEKVMSEAQSVVPEQESITSYPTEQTVTIQKPNMKVIVAVSLTVVLAAVLIAIIYYVSQPLHGDDKTAYDLITNSYYFRNARNIKVLSGDVGTLNGSGKKYACLTITYTDSYGKRVTGHYDITEDGVTDIEKDLAATKKIAEDDSNIGAMQSAKTKCRVLEASLSISNYDDKLNYEKITEELNK